MCLYALEAQGRVGTDYALTPFDSWLPTLASTYGTTTPFLPVRKLLQASTLQALTR